MCQKYAENMKKNVAAVWKLPAKRHSQFFHIFGIFSNYFIKNPQNTIAPTFLTHIISTICGVYYALELK